MEEEEDDEEDEDEVVVAGALEEELEAVVGMACEAGVMAAGDKAAAAGANALSFNPSFPCQ